MKDKISQCFYSNFNPDKAEKYNSLVVMIVFLSVIGAYAIS